MRHNGVALWVALLFASWAWADQEDRWVPFKQLSPNTPPGMVLATAPSEGQILMTLTESVTNWDSAAQLPGFQGWDYPVSNPCQPPNPSNWTGVSCEGGNVIRIELAGLDLAGTLPPDLLTLSQLQVLNLSSNSFTGTLPPQWSSLTLTQLDLSNNLLSGPLPVAYGSKETFPQLTKIFLQGNQFSGAMPGPEWTSYGFAAQAVITLRPGNWGLCGPVAIVDPRFYTTMPSGQDGTALLGPKSVSSTGVTSNTSQAYIVYSGLLGGTGIEPGVSAPPTTNVVVTNTLGSCADPCGRTAPLLTNIYDATWQNNVSLSDLVTYNPGLSVATAYPGMLLALPCYPAWLEPQTFNSDAAQGMFAGGNQQSVMGTVGAELAGGVVNPGGLNDSTTFYEGSRDWKYAPDGTMSAYLVEPVYWFVKLEATFTMSAMTITAGDAMSGITLYIGTDQAIVQGNREISSNMDFAPGESRVVPTGYVRGNMIILWAGYATEGNMSLANVKVWPAEGNAALNKPVYASSSPPDLNTTTDGSLTSCSYVKADNTGSAWFVVDLGYTADVATVVFTLQGGAENGTAQAFVSSDPSKSAVSNSTACGILPGAPWTERIGLECDKTGRYVGILAEGMDGFKVCELEVFLADEPNKSETQTFTASHVVGIAVGSAIGGAILVLAIVGGVVYMRRRRLHKQVAAHATGRGDSFSDPESGMSAGPRKDSFTNTSSAMLLARKWLHNISISGRHTPDSGMDSPSKLGAAETPTASTDLSKFTDGCDIIQFSDIELVRTIGEGSYGLVWMARYLQTTVAVKVLTHDAKKGTAGFESNSVPSAAVLTALQREASIMASLRHPNVAQYLGACLDPPALVLEYCSKRSVDRILAEGLEDPRMAKQLDWVHLLSMATDAAKGMLYLHTRSPPIVHRDLKSPNLLVDGLWHVKVSDFNLSRALEHNSVVSSLQITNPRWLAPEVLKGGQAGVAADVYSFGVVLWELLTWQLPWGHDANPFAIINTVVGGERLPLPAQDDLPAGPLQCYDEYVALIQRCWATDPDDRASMAEVAQTLRGLLAELVQTRIGGQANTNGAAGGSSGSSTVAEELP